MKSRGLIVAIALVSVAGVTGAAAQQKKEAAEATADKKISSKNLPPAVKATVEAESKGAVVKGISSEKEHGKTVYELETLVNGRTRDLMIDAAGKVYVVEEQLDVDKAPPAVKAALKGARSGGGLPEIFEGENPGRYPTAAGCLDRYPTAHWRGPSSG